MVRIFKIFLSILLIGMIFGVFILASPYNVIILSLLLFFIFISFLKFPKIFLKITLCFLLFQQLFTLQFDKIPSISLMLRRSEEIVILILFIATICKSLFKNNCLLKKSVIDISLYIFIIIALFSSMKANLVSVHIAFLDLFLLLKGFMVFYIFYNIDFTLEDLKSLLRTFFVISTSILFIGVIDLFFPKIIRIFLHNQVFIDYRFGIPSVQSIFIHPGHFGWFMAFSACFALAFYLITYKSKYFFVFIMFFFGIILSMRFKPLIGIFFATLVAYFFVAKNLKIKFLFIMFCFLLIFFVLFSDKSMLLVQDKFSFYLKNPQSEKVARNALYYTSFSIFSDYFPFGSGLGTFGGWIAALYYSPLYFKYGLNTVYGLEKGGLFLTDTFWPYIIAQFGLFGTIFYIVIFVILYFNLIKIFFSVKDVIVKSFILGVIMVLSEAFLESFAQHIFSAPPCFFFIFAVIGISFSSFKKMNTKHVVSGI